MSTTRIFDTRKPSHEANTIVIWPRAAARRLSASRGGRLEFAGGANIFPPGAFVDATGRPVVGEVDVSMSVLDLFDPRQVASAPGDFTARMRDGSVRDLETFGLFELVFADTAGDSVELARYRPARVELNISRLRHGLERRHKGAAHDISQFGSDLADAARQGVHESLGEQCERQFGRLGGDGRRSKPDERFPISEDGRKRCLGWLSLTEEFKT